MPALREVSAEAGKIILPPSAGGIRREIPFPGGQLNLQLANRVRPAILRSRTLLLAGKFYGDAQQQLAIALFHLTEQVPNSIEEATPFAREAPLLGRRILFPGDDQRLGGATALIKQLVEGYSHRARKLLKRFDGWGGGAVLHSGEVAS